VKRRELKRNEKNKIANKREKHGLSISSASAKRSVTS
jgi:hypothetical protein